MTTSFANEEFKDLNEVLNSELNTLSNWFPNNKLALNPSKCKNTLVTKARMAENNPKLEISINNESIPNQRKLILLGIEVDNQWESSEQITKICRKVSKQLGVIKRMQKISPIHEENFNRAFLVAYLS